MDNAQDNVDYTNAPDCAAIALVIRAETLAYKSKDFAAWAECFVQNEDTHDVHISDVAGLSVRQGWSEVASHMKRVFREGLTTDLLDFGQDNMRINIYGDIAWAVFDSWSETASGSSLRSFDVRILERVSGCWKIVFNAFVQREIDGALGNYVGVDARGKIVWASHTALKALDDHSVLANSSGWISARNVDWNKALQSAVAHAGRHHGFFETHRIADQFGGPARYPVVLGQNEDGGVAAVHIAIRDCITYVRVSGDEDLERRLQFAGTVFDLSPGQLRVAREIALGQSLKSLARKLSISVTTARTHLSRIYQKTGVSTQTALVRLLLSVG